MHPGADGQLYFRVLGPVSVERDGVRLDLGGPQRRLVLALLLSRANEVAAVDCLIDALWGDHPPPSHRVQLHGRISDLRRRLAPAAARTAAPIVTHHNGYLLAVPPDHYDLERFRVGVETARRHRSAGDDAAAIQLFRSALSLWRGPAFADASSPEIDRVAGWAEELRVSAVEECIDAQLADGRLAGLAAELVPLVAEHPLHEGFHRQLMTVYARTGRPAEALLVYRDLRRHLATELGVEPSLPLRHLHGQLLGSDEPAVPAGPAPTGVSTVHAVASAHRQLPPDITDFVGRHAELAKLLDAGTAADGTAPRVWVVEGMAGVGKTRLALRAAHQLVSAGRYADGQLYVDLRAFSPDADPADPAAVLESLLSLLGVPAPRIPVELDARSAVFRDRLTGQRILLLLDNAADEAQVAPLLPASPSCLVIVTSRRRLAVDGADLVRLGMLPGEDAVDVLAGSLGRDRVAAEPDAVRELAARCGHLPLALVLAGRRLRARPAWPVGHLVERLAGEERRLAELATGDRAVETAFGLSYDALAPAPQRMFRLLGIHVGPDFTAQSAAALTGTPVAEAHDTLESLLDAHLVEQSVVGRYHFHDLLRTYAVRRCADVDSGDERQAATTRLLDWYLNAVAQATAAIRRNPLVIRTALPPAPAPVPDLSVPDRALAWLDGEYPNLVAASRVAAAGPWPAHAVQLPHLLQAYYARRGRYADWAAMLHGAEQATRGDADPAMRAYTFLRLGRACALTGQKSAGLAHLREALRLHRELGDRTGEALAWYELGSVHRGLARYREAAENHGRAVDLLRDGGDPAHLSNALCQLAIALHLLGRHDDAFDRLHEGLALAERRGDVPGAVTMRANLARMYGQLDRHAEALDLVREALPAVRRLSNTPMEAHLLAQLGYSYARLGHHTEAVDATRQAFDIVRDFGDTEDKATVLNALADAHRFAGDQVAALGWYRQALAVATNAGDVENQETARAGIAVSGQR